MSLLIRLDDRSILLASMIVSNRKVGNEITSKIITASAKLFKLRSCHRLILGKIQINTMIDIIIPNAKLKPRNCLSIEIVTKLAIQLQKEESRRNLKGLIVRAEG
ncbi:MAG: hypothetical protein F4X84_05505 [Synechococcus sp. SB0662_bin_45]|nr:hypothetical protein [Synechococcus sp. SB0668_bin_13]MYE21808.1 hypothetical protein [Synechococcus sp. SB0662_bin_45]